MQPTKLSTVLPTIVNNSNNSHNITTDNSYNCSYIRKHQADLIIDKFQSLIDPDYRKWHYKKLFEIGEHKYRLCAEIAMGGDEPQKCFTYWLNNWRKI